MNPQQHSRYQEVSFDNSECTCFQIPTHNQKYFLSNYFSHLPLNNHSLHSQHHQTKETNLPIKRSIRRKNSPQLLYHDQNKQNSISLASLKMGENKNNNFTNVYQQKKTSKQIVNHYPLPIITFQTCQSNEIRKQNSQPITSQTVPNMLPINPQRSLQTLFAATPSAIPYTSTKIAFNIKQSAEQNNTKKQKNEIGVPSIQNHIIPIESFILTHNKNEKSKVSLKTIKQTLDIPTLMQMNQQKFQTPIKILKEEIQLHRSNKEPESQNSLIAIQIHKPLLQGRRTRKELLETAADSKNDAQLSSLSNRGSDPNFESLKQKKQIVKSIINTKKSLMSDNSKLKMALKKDKSKPVLSKMADVAQIHSLADQNQVMSSDQQSVVLGRLNEYGSMVIPRTDTAPPVLQKNFTQSSSSTILNINIKKSSELFRQFQNE